MFGKKSAQSEPVVGTPTPPEVDLILPPEPSLDPPIEEPPPVDNDHVAEGSERFSEPEPELKEIEKKIARVVEIIDTVRKNCDPADRHLLTELKDMLFPEEPEPEVPAEG